MIAARHPEIAPDSKDRASDAAPGTPSDEVADVLATGRGDISTLFVSMATPPSRGARRRISALAHPRPPARTASAGRRARLAAVGVDAGVPGRPRAERGALRRDRPRDDLLLHRPERTDGFLELSTALGGADRKLPLLPPVERGVYKVTEQDGRAASQGRRRRAAVVAGRGRVPAAGDGRDAPADLVDVDGVAGVWSATSLAVDARLASAPRGPDDHVLLPRRRPGRTAETAAAGARQAVERRRRRTAVRRAVSPRGAARVGSLCAVGGLNAHRPDGRLRQGALDGQTG